MVKAGVVAALALTLLVPTFNALNLSYVENVQPPPWIPTPDEPPNITPPTNFEPPPDFEPPEGYEGEIPPGACPPPVERRLNESEQQRTIQGPSTSWGDEVTFQVPPGAIAMKGFVNFTNWQAQSITVRLDGPEGFEGWTDGDTSQNGGLFGATNPETSRFVYQSFEGDQASPVPEGEYTLTLTAQFPISGRVTTLFGIALACGGMMSG